MVVAAKPRRPSRWQLGRRRARLQGVGFLPNEVLELQRVSLRFLNRMKILRTRRNAVRHVMEGYGVSKDKAINLVYSSFLSYGYRVIISDYIAWASDYLRGQADLDVERFL